MGGSRGSRRCNSTSPADGADLYKSAVAWVAEPISTENRSGAETGNNNRGCHQRSDKGHAVQKMVNPRSYHSASDTIPVVLGNREVGKCPKTANLSNGALQYEGVKAELQGDAYRALSPRISLGKVPVRISRNKRHKYRGFGANVSASDSFRLSWPFRLLQNPTHSVDWRLSQNPINV
jgi:hypothetical protein